MYKKFYVHEIDTVNLSKIYLLENAKKTCKTNNRDLNREWINVMKGMEYLLELSRFQCLSHYISGPDNEVLS